MESDMTPYGSQPHDEQAENPVPNGIVRDAPEPKDASRAAFVKEWSDKVHRAKKHWKTALGRMREDMDFYMGKQWPGQSPTDDRYVANWIQRHIGQRVSSLYAKNPKFVAKRRKTMDFAIWDGEMSTLPAIQTSYENSLATGQPIEPIVMQTITDIKQGYEKQTIMNKIAKTMEIVMQHQIAEQQPLFKSQMKQLVRRTCVTGVGYMKLNYHRLMDKKPEDAYRITDITEQIETLKRLMADQADEKFDENSAREEQLELLKKELSEIEDVIIREGLMFDFPLANSVIPDTKCRQLNGFVGADWVAQEFILTIDEVKEIYKVDLGKKYTDYKDKDRMGDTDLNEERAIIWEIYSKKDSMVYVIADGYPDFLKEPECPYLKIERFWPFFVLTFNEVESDKDIFPSSDVRLLTPIQREYNRARQSLREHRKANRPAYATYSGALSDTDINNLQAHPENAVIQLQNLSPGQPVSAILQPIQHTPIDPALYDTTPFLDDMMRVVGSQEANLGSTGSSTATEVSVAEGSRMSALGSNIDDLEDFLSEIARTAGQVLLEQMDQQTAIKIAGPGAVWPQLSANEIAQELYLEIEGGSNGRPNKAMDISNFERLAPVLLQIPGVSPEWMLRELIRRLDDGLDPEDALKSGLQSIVSQNAQKQLPGMQPQGGNPPSAGPGQLGNPSGGAPGAPAGPPQAAQPDPTHPTPGQIRSGHVQVQ